MNIKNLILFLMIIFNINLLASASLSKYFLNKTNITIPKKDFKENIKEFFYDNGAIKSRQFFINNKKVGRWQYFYESGKLKTEVLYNDDSLEERGTVKNYDENGVVISEGKILRDQMVDDWTYYDEQGKKVYSYNYSTGIIIPYDENGQSIMQLNEIALALKLNEIQQEIKDDRTKSTEEKN